MLVTATPLNFRQKKKHMSSKTVRCTFFLGGGREVRPLSWRFLSILGVFWLPDLKGQHVFASRSTTSLPPIWNMYVWPTKWPPSYRIVLLVGVHHVIYYIYMSKHYICIYNSTSNNRAALLHSMQLQVYSSLPTFLYNITEKTCVGIHNSYETHRFHSVFLAEHIIVSNQDQVYLPMITWIWCQD